MRDIEPSVTTFGISFYVQSINEKLLCHPTWGRRESGKRVIV